MQAMPSLSLSFPLAMLLLARAPLLVSPILSVLHEKNCRRCTEHGISSSNIPTTWGPLFQHPALNPPPSANRSQAMCLQSRMVPLTYDFPGRRMRGAEGREVGADEK